ncbi:hypothetical protein D0Z03_000049 [Geotrichum reessii]|nr:hypothetical protein D0Z03_000049 [Galactomyces reessii]
MASTRAINAIKKSITRLYPKELADSSWDNTGLLVEAPPAVTPATGNEKISILLAIDLTRKVVDEALAGRHTFIVAYHPFIFRGLKTIAPSRDSQQASLVRLIQAGVSVYCPHTAVDAARGGVNDWLADGVSGGIAHESQPREVVTAIEPAVDGHADAGMGRVVHLATPVSFNALVARIKAHLRLSHIQVALTDAHRADPDAATIRSVALCAGSGASVLRGVRNADVHFTGELGHHEALALVENGVSAIVCGHSNTERGFLVTLQKQLSVELKKDWDGEFEISVSKNDRDPLEIV